MMGGNWNGFGFRIRRYLCGDVIRWEIRVVGKLDGMNFICLFVRSCIHM